MGIGGKQGTVERHPFTSPGGMSMEQLIKQKRLTWERNGPHVSIRKKTCLGTERLRILHPSFQTQETKEGGAMGC